MTQILMITIFLLFSQFVHAQFDSTDGFSGSSNSGSSFDFSPSPSSDNGTLGGFGGLSGNSSTFSDLLSPSNPLSPLNHSNSSTSSSSSNLGGLNSFLGQTDIPNYPAAPLLPSWGSSVLNPKSNPVAEAILSSYQYNGAVPTQSLMALVTSRSPLALFFDLNGDGVKGDLIDGLLFNLYFGHLIDDRYEVIGNGSSRASVMEVKHKSSIDERMRAAISATRIVLVEELSDGRRLLPLKELVEMSQPTTHGVSDKDHQNALASLVFVTTLNPALAADNGPVLSHGSKKLSELVSGIKAGFKNKVFNDFKFKYQLGGSTLALETNTSRLALAFALVELSLSDNNSGGELHDETLDGLRAALYFTAFELNRLKVSKIDRDNTLKKIALVLAENAPEAMKLAAEQATSRKTISRLEETFLKVMPVLNIKPGLSRGWRIGISGLAAAGAVAAWMVGGNWAVEMLSQDIATQIVTDKINEVALPVASGFVANWLLSSKRLSLNSSQTQKSYTLLCESALQHR